MKRWIDQLLGREKAADLSSLQCVPDLQRRLRERDLELEEYQHKLAAVTIELERCQRDQGIRIAEGIEVQTASLATDIAKPLSQLHTQIHLTDTLLKPVQLRDVLAVTKVLIRTLRDHDIRLEGNVGERIGYNPNLHQPLSATDALVEGQDVVIRFVGAAYRGRLIRKAGVEKVRL
jgi:hypothetical protein